MVNQPSTQPNNRHINTIANTPTNLLSKEQVKAYLYLTSGKLDSVTKVFKRKIVIDRNDLVDLNRLVGDKLRNHNIEASMTSISVFFEKNKMTQFAFWQEFVDADWQIPEAIQSITMLWDFLVTLPNYTEPQRHTLTVKISSNAKFSSLLPVLLSSNVSEIDEVDLKHSPVTCQVNFINSLLSDELINIVEKWVDCRQESSVVTKTKKFIQEKRSLIADLVYYSIPLFIILISLSILYNHSKGLGNILTTNIMLYFIYWLFVSIVLFLVISKVAGRLAKRVYYEMSEYGDFLIFKITNGDRNKQDEIDKKNKQHFRKFLFNTIISLAINLISAIISYFLVR